MGGKVEFVMFFYACGASRVQQEFESFPEIFWKSRRRFLVWAFEQKITGQRCSFPLFSPFSPPPLLLLSPGRHASVCPPQHGEMYTR